MAFDVHLAQFDVAPTRTRVGILLICDYLINEIAKYVMSHLGGGSQKCDKDGGGSEKS